MSQSGSVLHSWALIENPLERAQKIAVKLNCTTETPKLMVDCFRKIDPSDLIEAMKVLYVYIDAIQYIIFGPTLEKGPNPFLADHPYKLLKEGKVYDVPWIASNVNDEGIIPAGRRKFYIIYLYQSLHDLFHIQ